MLLPFLQVSTSSAESRTAVRLSHHGSPADASPASAAVSSAFSLADLVARDVGGRQQAAWQAATQQTATPQLLYQSEWQAAEAAAHRSAPAKQPLLAALLGSGSTATVVAAAHAGQSHSAPAAQLLQGLQGGSLRSAWLWMLGSSLPATAGSSIAAPTKQQAATAAAAAGLHALLKVAAAEQVTAVDAAVVYGGAAAGSTASAARQAGSAADAATLYTPVLLPSSAVTSSAVAPSPVASGSSGAAVITGGLGGLGLLTAAWMQRQGQCQHLVLLGRSGRGDNSSLAGLTTDDSSSGTVLVTMARCDVAVAEEAAAAAAAAARTCPVQAVLHAGGVLADALLQNQTAATMRAVAAPKLAGLQRLAAATGRQPLHQLLLFSSIAGELGTAGQGNYAHANAALDATAAAMQGSGRTSGSVQWGAWAGAGMAAAEPLLLLKLQRQGYGAVQPTAGLAALHQLMRCSTSGTVPAIAMAAPYDWPRFLASPARRQLPYFAAVQPQATGLTEQQRSMQHSASSRQATFATAAAVTAASLLPAVQQLLPELAGNSGDLVPAHVPFMEAGLDSIGAVELRWAGITWQLCTPRVLSVCLIPTT